MNTVEQVARRILAQWDNWEAEAGQQSQFEQNAEVGETILLSHLMVELSELVECAAMVCEGRAHVRENQIPIYNEAMKCAGQIRHNLFASAPSP